ncbi:MAG: type II toxin-antitoxin system VapC family toxin, partial [Proteobacteria bacterium]|nr:type II toxin-antitoxin system VapC family toxin [Pseudomonadota bacterium]
ATTEWLVVLEESQPLRTSSFVIDEALTLLGRRATHTFAAARGRDLYTSTRIEILRPEATDELLALKTFAKLADQQVSFTDCISFVLMRKYRIPTAFTFDRHFNAAGFAIRPDL